jgi:microcystin-dependent protein
MEGTIGEIRMFAGNFAPRTWAFCQGQLTSIAQNTALFSILGTTYGGDGRTTFGLPESRGRVMVGVGQGPGLQNVQLGELSGSNSVTLATANMPVHSHPLTGAINVQANNDAGGLSPDPSNKRLAASGGNLFSASTSDLVNMAAPASTLAIGNTGGSQGFSIMQPFLGMNYIICLQGIFPSRN